MRLLFSTANRLCILWLVFILTVVGCQSTPVPTPFPTPAASILFVSERNGMDDIYLMKSDGTELRNLTPDCTFIYVDRPPDNHQKEVNQPSNADCGPDERLYVEGRIYDAHPAWSPDGKQFAFVSNRSPSRFNTYQLFVMDIATGEMRMVTDEAENIFHPDWSPDGEWIVYEFRPELAKIRVDGSEKTVLTTYDANQATSDAGPVWSPDGKQIAFTRRTSDNKTSNIFVMNDDGSSLQQLTDVGHSTTTWLCCLDWSHDGERLIFASNFEGSFELYTYTFATTEITKIMQAVSGVKLEPNWSEDDQWILFDLETGTREGGQEEWAICFARPIGQDVQCLTDYATHYTMPQWQPLHSE